MIDLQQSPHRTGEHLMITVDQAIDAAIGYVNQFKGVMPSEHVRLEEFELDDAHRVWLITLSLTEQSAFVLKSREYKTFTVDGETGDVLSMKIRNPLARA
jgi:hypothetical protein